MQFKSFAMTAAAAASMLASVGAAAQTSNVTIYGIVDAGPEIINNAGAKGNTLERISSGNLTGSRIGFRGVEDLGGGLAAVFTLENGLDVSTGTALQGGRMFGRQAFVGLQGRWGSLLVGRQNSLQLEWMSKYNTMNNSTWSSKVHDTSFSDRIDNAVKYTVKVADPVAISMYYSTGYNSTKGGEIAGAAKAGRQYGIGTQYTGGTMRLGAVYDSKNGLTAVSASDTDRHLTLGARYRLADNVEAMGGYLFRKQDTANVVTRTDLYWIGAAWQITGPFQLTASYYHTDLKGSDQDPSSIVTSLKYTLSKRTDLYLINSYVMNRGGSNLGVNGFGADITPGSNQFGTMFGIRHTF